MAEGMNRPFIDLLLEEEFKWGYFSFRDWKMRYRPIHRCSFAHLRVEFRLLTQTAQDANGIQRSTKCPQGLWFPGLTVTSSRYPLGGQVNPLPATPIKLWYTNILTGTRPLPADFWDYWLRRHFFLWLISFRLWWLFFYPDNHTDFLENVITFLQVLCHNPVLLVVLITVK